VLADYQFWVALLAATGCGLGLLWWLLGRRVTAEELERRRRLRIHAIHRTTEAMITDAGPEIVHYSYAVRGVTYFASQDVRSLQSLLPPDPAHLVGPAGVHYDPRNPANSIVCCEGWTGWRDRA
jgi:hypothetical protein